MLNHNLRHLNENDLIARAYAAYNKSKSYADPEPILSSSFVDGDRVYLQNVNGILAEFRIDNSDVRRLRATLRRVMYSLDEV
jgi:hypothetical protein